LPDEDVFFFKFEPLQREIAERDFLQISAWKSEPQPSGCRRRDAARFNRKPRFSVDDPPQGKVYFSMRISVSLNLPREAEADWPFQGG
jgi:hypothetical protein